MKYDNLQLLTAVLLSLILGLAIVFACSDEGNNDSSGDDALDDDTADDDIVDDDAVDDDTGDDDSIDDDAVDDDTVDDDSTDDDTGDNDTADDDTVDDDTVDDDTVDDDTVDDDAVDDDTIDDDTVDDDTVDDDTTPSWEDLCTQFADYLINGCGWPDIFGMDQAGATTACIDMTGGFPWECMVECWQTDNFCFDLNNCINECFKAARTH